MKKLLVLIWILSVCIAFFIGYKTQSIFQEVHHQSNHQSDSMNAGDELYLSASSDIPENNQPSIQQNYRNAEKIQSPTLKEVLTEIKTILNDGYLSLNIASLAESYNLIKGLTEEELNEMLGLIDFNSNAPNDIMLMTTMMSRFAEINPQASLRYPGQSEAPSGVRDLARYGV